MAVSLTVDIRHVSTNASARTATVTVKAMATTTGSSYNNLSPSGTYELKATTGTITSPSTTTGTFSHNIPANSTTVIYTQSMTIKYTDEGKATAYALITFNTGTSSGNLQKSATYALPDIEPKWSGELTVTGLSSTGDNHLDQLYYVNISMPTMVSGSIGYNCFVHKWGTLPSGGRSIGTGTSTSGSMVTLPWTPSSEQYEQYLTNATSDTCELWCQCSQNGRVFMTLTASFTLALSDGYGPKIGDITITDSSGMLESTGVVVSGVSDLTITAHVTMAGAATLESVRMQALNRSYAMTSSDGVTWSASTGIINQYSDSWTSYVRAEDSRGLQDIKYFSLTTQSDTSPSLDGTKAYRYNTSTGLEDDESSTVRVNIVCAMPNVGSSSGGTVRIRYAVSGSSSWTTAATISVGSTYNGYRNISNLSPDNNYSIEVTATTSTGFSTTMEILVGSAAPIMDFKADEAIALWGVASEPGLTVHKQTTLKGDVYVQADGASMEQLFKLSDRASSGTTSVEVNAGVYIKAGQVFGTTDQYEQGIVDPFIIPDGSGRPVIHNHFALADGMYLQGKLHSGNYTNILRIYNDEVCLYWTSGGLGGRVMQRLWSGTMSAGGSATISTLAYYRIFAVKCSGINFLLIGCMDSGRTELACHANHLTGSATLLMAASFTVSGNKLTLRASGFNAADSSHTWTVNSVKEIWGVI